MSVVLFCSFLMTASKWGSETHFCMFTKCVLKLCLGIQSSNHKAHFGFCSMKLGNSGRVVALPLRNNTPIFYFNELKKKARKHPALILPHPFFFFFVCKQNRSCHLELPNTDHMWVQHWQSDYIVEQAVEFIRKKLARHSAGLSPIGQSRGLLRLRAPQTFLRIIFSIPLLSSVRTDQITAQGLHCEGLFKKSCFQCCLSFMLSLSLTS